ncbi:MAG: geranylgeranyl reductase family protein [Acidimicrobiia bacterium]
MSSGRFDALVVGAGPAGSTAALVLARGGARVALVDKAAFPRDKACGDLVGPRGVQVLSDLGIGMTEAATVGDMIVVGPTGRRVRLPAFTGRTYPGHAIAVPRRDFDDALRNAALAAGAEAITGRAERPLFGDAGLEGFALSSGAELRADIVLGADGATSRVAAAADLVDPQRVLWAFAVRAYTEAHTDRPHIAFWEPTRGRAFPGYGWLFPGPAGHSNLGLGIGMRSARNAASTVTRQLPAFITHLRELGLIDTGTHRNPLGGWLKLGLVGTTPARGRVLLIGDAAGLVNPLQGEGIGAALASGRAAAEATLSGPPRAVARYRAYLRTTHVRYMASTAPAHAALLGRPRTIAVLARALTAPIVSTAIAGAWSLYWNDLIVGATRRPSAAVAGAVAELGSLATSRSDTARWITQTLETDAPAPALNGGDVPADVADVESLDHA